MLLCISPTFGTTTSLRGFHIEADGRTDGPCSRGQRGVRAPRPVFSGPPFGCARLPAQDHLALLACLLSSFLHHNRPVSVAPLVPLARPSTSSRGGRRSLTSLALACSLTSPHRPHRLRSRRACCFLLQTMAPQDRKTVACNELEQYFEKVRISLAVLLLSIAHPPPPSLANRHPDP